METQERMQKQAYREKNWDELDLVEKVDRMRGVVKDLRRTVETQRKIIRKLRTHAHLNNKMYYDLALDSEGEGEDASLRGNWF